MKELTKLQQKYYDWLLRTMLKNHNFPTRSEAADHFDVGLNTVNSYLCVLEKKGHIKKVYLSPKYRFTNVKLVISDK